MLGSADLSYMRSSIDELLPDTANILSCTYASDGQGGYTQTWGTTSAGVRCRLDPGRKESSERLQGGAVILPYSYWILTLEHGASLSAEQRVRIGGDTYEVRSVDVGKSWSGSVRAAVTRAD